MKRVAWIALLFVLIVGCESSSISDDPDVGSTPTPDMIEISDDVNVVFCDHKYSAQRDFYYMGRMASSTEMLFGQNVTMFTFTLLDNTKKYLSSTEFVNYVCE